MEYQKLAEKSLSGSSLSIEECRKVLDCPDIEILDLLNATYKVRHKYQGNIVNIQVLSNAKSGLCSEDCHYCSQSRISKANIEKYPLKTKDSLISEALKAKEISAIRYCMALSGKAPSDKEIDILCEVIKDIKEKTNLSICCSIGFIKKEQAEKLKAAGLNRVNHNLNTSKRFHPEICTTHSYKDRVETIKLCKSLGLEVCSGGIFGQGETQDDIIDILMALRELKPEAIPLNFLIPVPGTPFEDRAVDLNPRFCLKILCLARFLNPESEIRVAGGREYHLRSLNPLALYAADSIFVCGYLTEGGQPADEAFEMIKDLGFEIKIEGASDH